MNILEVKSITAQYDNTLEPAIENISFNLEKGTITALLGPNGSGKSTILKAILGSISFSGEILINGVKASKKLGIVSYVPQRFNFDTSFPLTVYEFLNISAPETINQSIQISKVLDQIEMIKFKDSLLSQLSGGQLQRVLIARALLKEPQLLILDEPESGIDINISQKFYNLIKFLVATKGLTVLIATHELEIINSFSDQVICINKNILCSGRPSDVLDSNFFSRLYGTNVKIYPHKH
jgi:ABC-type Mn2+/Zn2+ transport system ATPase subunit